MLSALKKHAFSSSPKLPSDKIDYRTMLIRPYRVDHVHRGQKNADRKQGDEYFVKG
jgi:hypothetical protein